MTELAIRRESTVSLIQDTARDLSAAMQIATALVKTPFVPQHFRGKPEDAAAAILYGATIDMDPTTALQNIYVVSGKPALYARTMVAIVLSHGHEIWTEEESEGTVTVCGQRKGSSRIEKVTWNTEMAKRAGYTKNSKYQSDPRSMLYARASGDVARRVAPDALLGMGYTREELELEGELAEEKPAIKARSSVSRLRAAIAPAEQEQEAQVEPDPQPEPVQVTKEQLSRLAALLTERGFTDKTEGLAYLERHIGRPVGSSKALTTDEANVVIAALEARGEPDAPVDAELVPDDVDIDNDPMLPEEAS
jgi:hypothetical protein